MISTATAAKVLKITSKAASWGIKAAEENLTPAIEIPEVSIFVNSAQGDYIIDAKSAAEIEEFLTLPAVTTLLRLNFIRKMSPAKDAIALAAYAGESTFVAFVDSWCRLKGHVWSSLASSIWSQLEQDQNMLLERLIDGKVLTNDAREILANRFLFGRHVGEIPAPEYLQILEQLATSLTRQEKLQSFITEARRIGLSSEDEFLVQGSEGDTASFNDLYIDRSLIDANTGDILSASSQLDVDRSNPRIVIVGNPGVGKTTLTLWVRWKLGSLAGAEPVPLPVTLVARHVLSATNSSVVAALKTQIETDYQLSLSSETFLDLLATGWVMPIVDGIDEILIKSQRRKIVEQLHTFAKRFPVVSMVCSTRRTGFEVSLFSADVFRVFNLEEYSEAQVSEYAHRWFGKFTTQPVKAEHFLGESRALTDLRRNPLMLALLCTLYRQSDYIPRSRREVYLRCAALMFHEWDPRRGIAIPNLFKNEGEAILRDIALLFQRVGGGKSVQGHQLEKLIATYLVGKGEERITASTAARDLLEYCSGRAWILSKVAGSGDEAEFAFTHRTFFEFFASEGLVRKLNRANALQEPSIGATPGHLGPLSSEIVKAYNSDTTSVMPELLLQAADDLMGGISTVVLQELLREARRTNSIELATSLMTLAVRLIAAVGVNADIAKGVFGTLLRAWEEPLISSPSELVGELDAFAEFKERQKHTYEQMVQFRAVLDVGSGHRTRLIDQVSANKALAIAYLQRYARLDFIQESGLYSDDWREAATKVAIEYSDELGLDPFVSQYALSVKVIDLDKVMQTLRGPDLLYLSYGDTDRPGPLWSSISDTKVSSKRQKSWAHATDSLVRSQSIGIDPLDLDDCLESSPGLSEAGIFPTELALCLSLLILPSRHKRLAEVTRNDSWLEVTAFVRSMASEVNESRNSLTLDDAEVGRYRKRINAHYRSMVGSPCPAWVRDYIGIGNKKKPSLQWY